MSFGLDIACDGILVLVLHFYRVERAVYVPGTSKTEMRLAYVLVTYACSERYPRVHFATWLLVPLAWTASEPVNLCHKNAYTDKASMHP